MKNKFVYKEPMLQIFSGLDSLASEYSAGHGLCSISPVNTVPPEQWTDGYKIQVLVNLLHDRNPEAKS